jgi:hypothetical protein
VLLIITKQTQAQLHIAEARLHIWISNRAILFLQNADIYRTSNYGNDDPHYPKQGKSTTNGKNNQNNDHLVWSH